MRYAQIEQNDACTVIKSRDTELTFHYVDPPYIDSNQGHYGGYTVDHYRKLLDTLSQIKGKFMLSSYPSEILSEYIEKYGWTSIEIEKRLNAGNGAVSPKRMKTEVLTMNYKI